tara:strand:+ start:880 stop:1131 length:252 start_codon:yes stop_codon:yes gene_type:complete
MEETTGLNGYTLKDCLSKSLSEMYSNPQYYEDLHMIAEDFQHTVEDLENQIRDLTTLLEHYELKAMRKERTNILYRHKYNKED